MNTSNMKWFLSAIAIVLQFAFFFESPAGGDEPAAWWRFEEAGEIIRDSSGNGNHAVAKSVRLSPGIEGQAAAFNGESGVEVPQSASLAFDRPFTIECWVKPTDLSATQGAMNLLSCEGSFILRIDPISRGHNISFFVESDGTLEPRVRGPAAEPDRWHHIIALRNREAAFLWADGQEFSVRRGKQIPAAKAPLSIGGPALRAEGFRGLMDEVKIYNVACSRQTIERMIWMPGGLPSQDRVNCSAFNFPEDMAGWESKWGADLEPGEGCLRVRLCTRQSAIVHPRLNVPLMGNEKVFLRMAADRGRVGEIVLLTSAGFSVEDFVVVADGGMRDYVIQPRSEKWAGSLLALGLKPSDEEGAVAAVDWVEITQETPSPPPRILISEFAPLSRINQTGKDAEIHAILRNEGGVAQHLKALLEPPSSVEVAESPEQHIESLASGEDVALKWRLRCAKEAKEIVRMSVSIGEEKICQAERPIEFSNDSRAAILRTWRGRPYLEAGYPRAMDFRHLGPSAIGTFECDTALLVDFIGDKIEAAREFKKRYPDRLVLMQVNDEVNGLWGSWCTVPREFALKEGLRCRPDVFPMPDFKGYWLLMPGDMLKTEMPVDVEELEISLDHPERFIRVVRDKTHFPDVLIYPLKNDQRDWAQAEYASVLSVDVPCKQVRVKRWPRIEGYAWHGYAAEQTYIAPSAGDIYVMKGAKKTWIPNLTKFCPRDPKTGLDAAEWWARHFATLWHEKIARDEPHPDGYEFDMPPFRAHNKDSDCDNDGQADACEFDGISYWGLGMHRFFYLLRNGFDDVKGIGWDALLLSDSSSTACQRSFDLLNGSENEEFCGFGRANDFSSQLDLYLLWCGEARAPRVSYLQSRFPCEIYFDGSLHEARRNSNFRTSNHVRLGAAAACMGLGVHTYRPGGRSDIDMICQGGGRMRFDWDEYCAGKLNRYNWLGQPLDEAMRLPNAVAPKPIFKDDFEAGVQLWEYKYDPTVVEVSPITASRRDEGGHVLRCDVKEIKMRLPKQEAAMVVSPPANEEVIQGKEYVLAFDISANPQYDEREGELYADIKREIRVQLLIDEARTQVQAILVGSEWRKVHLTFLAPASGPARIAFQHGAELGPVFIDNVELREGCADVMYRVFEHGMVLMNGSLTSPHEFDLLSIGGGRKYKRLDGLLTPIPNNGKAVKGAIVVPASDALFLMSE